MINLFNSKTLLKLVAKTLKKMGIFSLEILNQNSPKGPFQKLAVGPRQQKISAVGRPPG